MKGFFFQLLIVIGWEDLAFPNKFEKKKKRKYG